MISYESDRSIHRIQAVKASMTLTMKNFFADPQWIIPSIIAPFIFTLVSLFLFRNVNGPVLLYAVLGGGMMGMWGTTVYGSGTSIMFDRWNGTMEATLSAPSPLIWIVMGRVIFNTLEGMVNAIFILFIGLMWFRVGVSIYEPLQFSIATILTFISLSAVGLILSSVYVLTRKAGFLENGLEIPVYIATGTMFPIALLPFYVQGFSFALGPTWGIDAIRISAIQGYLGFSTGYVLDLIIMCLETAVYFFLSFILFTKVESRAKINGTLGEY